jgi:hypothetical protein
VETIHDSELQLGTRETDNRRERKNKCKNIGKKKVVASKDHQGFEPPTSGSKTSIIMTEPICYLDEKIVHSPTD